jgi:hypothetical protein
MESYDDVLGYLKYSGESVEEGFLDARKSAGALLGLDEAIRHFVSQELPELDNINYEIPVRIRKGSWEAIIPQTIGDWFVTGSGLAATAYVTTAAKELAKNDFKDVTLKKVFIKAFKSIQWFISIGKHLRTLKQKRFEKVKFSENNRIIGIPNEKGEYLYVPKEYLDLYVSCNSKLLEEVAKVIEADRSLIVGVVENEVPEEVELTAKDKYIFYEEDTEEVLFPELVHGQMVDLEGDITRGNENSNNLGFRYDGHILTIMPDRGSIVRYKHTLFLKCIVSGRISRLDKFGNITKRKPDIIFSTITPIELDTENKLF